jgi:hypothetical protein
MKIKLYDGEELDTDKLSDGEAIIVEKINELYTLCQQYRVPLYASVFIKKEKPMSVHIYNGLDEYMSLLAYACYNFSSYSNGAIKLVAVANEENEEIFKPEEE